MSTLAWKARWASSKEGRVFSGILSSLPFVKTHATHAFIQNEIFTFTGVNGTSPDTTSKGYTPPRVKASFLPRLRRMYFGAQSDTRVFV